MPARYAPLLFGFLLSIFMTFIISGVVTLWNFGLVDGVVSIWASGWITSWVVAFPSVLFVAPFVRRIVGRIVATPPPPTPTPTQDQAPGKPPV